MFKLKAIRLELCTICQLQCRLCPNPKGFFKDNIGYGYMKFADFKKIVDRNPYLKRIEISNYGEIFLNPDFNKILKYAYQKKIWLYALNGSNFNSVSENTIENLVKYKFRKLLISIDGTDQKTYSIYRQKGNFNTVINNIEILNEYKKKYKTQYPKLIWQFILFGHNQHQLEEAKAYAKRYNMYLQVAKNWDPSYSPVKGSEKNEWRKKMEKKKEKHSFFSLCSQLWYMPQINWDGRLLGCCVNFWTDYGNVLHMNIKQAIQGKEFQNTKDILTGKKPASNDFPCFRCRTYKKFIRANMRIFRFIKFIYYLLIRFSYYN